MFGGWRDLLKLRSAMGMWTGNTLRGGEDGRGVAPLPANQADR